MYAGTVWLGRTEDEVWNMTARKLHALLTVHYEILRAKSGDKPTPQVNGFIDDIPGW